ncbi:hypothetical protein [Flavobacterium sp.]|uniref:hypothetical protein n=1 Tax=Flavobacterium sp. TaxID=239 RepID=UPI00286E5123|nr:hypothetical protein [Flavobacterium sp.]
MNLELLQRIEKSSAHTQNRINNRDFIIQNPHLVEELVLFSFKVDNKLHIRGCYILEKVFEQQLDLSFPFLDLICDQINKLQNDSAIRCVSRFLAFLVQDNSKKNYLTENQLEQITESSFDWLISDYRVAVKHHAVKILIETGKKSAWIYPELKIILEKEIEFPSPGYKSIVKKFLNKIN